MKFAVVVGICTMLSLRAQTPRVMVVGGSYIGVGMQEIDSERAKALKLHDETGVEITVVEQDSPAEKAGLKVGDVVLRYNGVRLEGNDQFARMVRETAAGREVKVDISRAGMPQTLTVRVAQRKMQKMEWNEMPAMAVNIHLPDLPHTFMAFRISALGAEAESIDGQLAQYFGVKDGTLVRSVMKGSAAEKAGIRAGDVILKIDDARVASPLEISSQLRSLRGKPAPVLLMRDHKELTVNVTVEDDGGSIQVTPFQVQPKPNQN